MTTVGTEISKHKTMFAFCYNFIFYVLSIYVSIAHVSMFCVLCFQFSEFMFGVVCFNVHMFYVSYGLFVVVYVLMFRCFYVVIQQKRTP